MEALFAHFASSERKKVVAVQREINGNPSSVIVVFIYVYNRTIPIHPASCPAEVNN